MTRITPGKAVTRETANEYRKGLVGQVPADAIAPSGGSTMSSSEFGKVQLEDFQPQTISTQEDLPSEADRLAWV